LQRAYDTWPIPDSIEQSRIIFNECPVLFPAGWYFIIACGNLDRSIRRICCIPSFFIVADFPKTGSVFEVRSKKKTEFFFHQSVVSGFPTKISSLCFTSLSMHRTDCTAPPEPITILTLKEVVFNSHKSLMQ